MSHASIQTAKAQGLALGFGLTFSACFMTFGAVGGFGLLGGRENLCEQRQQDACAIQHEARQDQPIGDLRGYANCESKVHSGLVGAPEGDQQQGQRNCQPSNPPADCRPRPDCNSQPSNCRPDQRYDERLNCIHVAPCASWEAYQPKGGPA